MFNQSYNSQARGSDVATLKVRTDELARRRRAAGIDDTHIALARYLGVTCGTVSRIYAGKAEPGPRFIAAALAAFPDARMDDLFEVVDAAAAAP